MKWKNCSLLIDLFTHTRFESFWIHQFPAIADISLISSELVKIIFGIQNLLINTICNLALT